MAPRIAQSAIPDQAPNRGGGSEFLIPDRPPRASEDAAHFVRANGLWHHVLEYGAGRAVVIVPGMTASAATFSFVAMRLAPCFGVFVVDVRGRGLSDHPASGFSLAEYAADLAGVIERLRLEGPVVVGHSMGARIAAALDVTHPGLCGGLVLADPPLSGPGRDPYPYPPSMYTSMFAAARATDPIPGMRSAEPMASDEALVERVRWLRVTDQHAVLETHRNFHAEDYHALHARITAPAILVRGADSAVVTDSGAVELRALRPDVPVVDVADAGHLVPQEAPDAFCAIVEAFVRELGAPSRDTCSESPEQRA
jgi:N-formylmaleamate deformylase